MVSLWEVGREDITPGQARQAVLDGELAHADDDVRARFSTLSDADVRRVADAMRYFLEPYRREDGIDPTGVIEAVERWERALRRE